MPLPERVIEYNDNKRIIIKDKNIHIKVYKCPYYNCDKIFFDQDSLNQHLIYDHAEVPKNLWNGVNLDGKKYFNRTALLRLDAKYKRKELEHLLAFLGYEFDYNLLERFKRWIDVRRTKP